MVSVFPRAAVSAPPSVSRDQPRMLLWLLVLSALSAGVWGEFSFIRPETGDRDGLSGLTPGLL